MKVFFSFLFIFLCTVFAIGANAMVICIGADCPNSAIAVTTTAAPETTVTAESRHPFRIYFGERFNLLPAANVPSANSTSAGNDTTHPFLSVHFGSSHPLFSFPECNPFSRLNMTEIRLPLEEFMMSITEDQLVGLTSLIPEADRTWPTEVRWVSVEKSGSLQAVGQIGNPLDIVLPEDVAADTDSNVASDYGIENRGYPKPVIGLPKITLKVPKVFRVKGDLPTAGFKKGVELKGKWFKDGLTVVQKTVAGAWWSAVGADTDKQIAKPHEKRGAVIFWCDGANVTECGAEFDDLKDGSSHQRVAVTLANTLSTSYLARLKEVKLFGPRYINSPRFFETNAAEVHFINLINSILESHHSTNTTAPALQKSFDDWSKMLNWTLKEWRPAAHTNVEIAVTSLADDTPVLSVSEGAPTPVKRHIIMATSMADLRAYEAMKAMHEGKGYHLSPLKDSIEIEIPTALEPPRNHYMTDVERVKKYDDDINAERTHLGG